MHSEVGVSVNRHIENVYHVLMGRRSSDRLNLKVRGV